MLKACKYICVGRFLLNEGVSLCRIICFLIHPQLKEMRSQYSDENVNFSLIRPEFNRNRTFEILLFLTKDSTQAQFAPCMSQGVAVS